MAKVEALIEKLKAEILDMHGQLVAEKLAHARSLLGNVRLQRDMHKAVKEKEEATRLFTLEHAKRENSVEVEQLKKDVLTAPIKGRNRLPL